jgi:hypothetical protein
VDVNTWLVGIVLVWLGVVSWFDLRTKEIPHSAWVFLPLIGAATYRLVLGNWQLVLLAVVVILASERARIAQWSQIESTAGVFFWIPAIGFLIYLAALQNPLGAIAVVAFWAAWELHAWGGADAVASIALVLLWPDLRLVLSLLIVHFAAALVVTAISLVNEHKFRLHQLPGLPLLFTAVALRIFLSLG